GIGSAALRRLGESEEDRNKADDGGSEDQTVAGSTRVVLCHRETLRSLRVLPHDGRPDPAEEDERDGIPADEDGNGPGRANQQGNCEGDDPRAGSDQDTTPTEALNIRR